MSDVSKRTRRIHKVEVFVPNPTNLAELSKAMIQVQSQYKIDVGGQLYDDSITVCATDEEIIFSYTVSDNIEGAPHVDA